MGGKRGNENAQMRREEYDAMERSSANSSKPTGGFQRADGEQMKKRRVLKVSRGKFGAAKRSAAASDGGGGGSGAAAPAAPRPPPSAASFAGAFGASSSAAAGGGASSSNPFGGIKLAAPASSAGESVAPKNPFAGVSFASSGSSSSTPSFSIGTAKAPAPASGRLFGSGPPLASAAPPPSTATSSASGGAKGGSGMGQRPDRDLNKTFLRMAEDAWKMSTISDWSGWMEEYIKYAGQVKREMEGGSTRAPPSTPAPAEPSGFAASAQAPSPAVTSAPAADAAPKPMFSFGEPPKEAPKPFNFGFGTSAAGTSTSAGTATSTSPKPFSGFNFGAAAKASPKAAPMLAAAAPSGSDGGDAAVAEKPEPAVAQKDDNENILHAVRSRYYKHIDGNWKQFATGVIRLYESKDDPSQKRMVMRNEVGKVQLNLSVTTGMKFEKQKNKGKGFVRFLAVQEKEKGVEKFMLQVKGDNVDELHSNLEKMAA